MRSGGNIFLLKVQIKFIKELKRVLGLNIKFKVVYHRKQMNDSSLNNSTVPQPEETEGQNELLDGQSTEIDNYVHKKDLGKGLFGNVFTVKNKFTRYQYAMKIVEMPSIEVEKKIAQMITRVYQFQHLRNLVKIINFKIKDVRKNPNKKWIYILQEICQQNIKQEIDTRFSLNENNKTYYTEGEMRNLILPLLVLFAKLQKFNIAHRSIKPENILRGFDNEVKISDLGCVNPMMQYYVSDLKGYPNRDVKNLQSIPNYFSPERLEKWKDGLDITDNQIYKSDVFSLGLVFVQIGNLSKLMLGANQNKQKLKNQIHQFSKRYSLELTNLLKQMLKWDILPRVDFIQLIKNASDKEFFSSRFQIFINDGSNSNNIQVPDYNLENKQVKQLKQELDIQIQIVSQLKKEIRKIKKSEQELMSQLELKSETSFLQTQKDKVIFFSNEVEILIQYLKELKSKKQYTEMKIDFQYSEDNLTYYFPTISQELKDNVNIRKLVIDLEGLEYEDSQIKPLFQNVNTLTFIEYFELILDATEIEDEGLSSIVTNLYEKESLHTLIINCRETNIQTGKGIQKLSNVIRSLSNLKTFKLELYCTETSSESVLKIFEALKDCNCLEKIFIGLGETKINNSVRKIGSIMSEFLNLKSFEIYLGETIVGDETFKSISSCFLNSTRIEEFKLNFGQTKITNNQGMHLLAQTLQTLVNLQKFDIEVYQTNVSDEGLKAVFKSLAELERLQSLSFGLGETKINDVGTISELGKTIKQLGLLQEFTVVAFKTNINDQGFLNLMESFQNKDDLKTLVVSFGRTKICKDESFKVFGEIFENKTEMEKLNCFFQQTQIGDAALLHFGNSLKFLTSLKEVAFHFGETKIREDTGFLAMIDAMKNMHRLEKLQFFLYGKKVMISKDSTLKFIKMIEEHETLRELRHKINSNAYSPESLIVKFQNLENILDERMIQFKDNGEDLDF